LGDKLYKSLFYDSGYSLLIGLPAAAVTEGVNFINIFARFFADILVSKITKLKRLALKFFCAKISAKKHAKNVDEIDGRIASNRSASFMNDSSYRIKLCPL